jgi:hypothetical protein
MVFIGNVPLMLWRCPEMGNDPKQRSCTQRPVCIGLLLDVSGCAQYCLLWRYHDKCEQWKEHLKRHKSEFGIQDKKIELKPFYTFTVDVERRMTYQDRQNCFQLDMSTLISRGKEFIVTEGRSFITT